MTTIDYQILLWIQTYLRFPLATTFWSLITKLGDHGIFLISLTLLLLCIAKTRKTGLTMLLSLVFTAIVVVVILKPIVARARPFDTFTDLIPLVKRPTDYSFPSGHTSASMTCATAIFLSMKEKKYGIIAFVVAALIGFSRLYLGVHYPSDVITGAVIGIACACLAYLLMQRLERRIHSNDSN